GTGLTGKQLAGRRRSFLHRPAGSRGAATRSSATSSGSGCSACRKNRRSTATGRSGSSASAPGLLRRAWGRASVGGANLVLTEEQDELRRSLRRFLGDRSPMSRGRQTIESTEGYDRALWDRMAADLSLQGMAVPDTCGGAGFGQVEMSVVMEELGRALVPSPFLASAVLATNALLALDDADARRELLPSIAAGHTIATLAVAEEGGGWDASKIATTAVLDGDGWRLQGTKTPVVDGFAADLVVVVAHAGGELGFFIIDGDAPGLSRTRLAGLDLTRQLASLEFSGSPARRL